ncbi:alanine racemase [Carbonactinospora thermoautotrophica]|uniref:Alanine racemase n=1 Tax=Carbonactinospora thermoautotrophica TaxID=1469144 RepID=A0A132N0L6_9ACTN|nr:alanine racemase [Carbonactinospora thermoautotrophica]KWX03698.1 alanine racemase [Carbonactinospora thermoautotrophica]KWX06400.1 alanine racemase [Carbonactinospora thermoautotrophica]
MANSEPTRGRAEARIDLTAIRENTARMRERAPSAALMAVVKADGYGHGMVPAARAALAGGATWLGTAFISEGLRLRQAGITTRILSWLAVPGDDWAAAIQAAIDLSANAVWAIEEIAAAAAQAGVPARVHLKIDSGLGRAGATPQEWPRVVDAALKAQADGLLQVVGLWSHFACADEPGHPSITRQLATFREAVEYAERAGIRPEVRHIANSPATLTLPEAHLDLIRAGITIYGLSPAPELGTARELGLRPAMTLAARLALVKRVPPGHGVSYGHRYVTDRNTTLALVPVGYADGVPRAAGDRCEVLLAGQRRAIRGRVAMDQFVVELGDDDAACGEEVLLFGPGDFGEPTADDWARALDTIAYEIVTRVGPRVPRVYLGAPQAEQASGIGVSR